MYNNLENALRGARSARFDIPLGHCLDEGIWAEIAAGIRTDNESLPLLKHAAKCDSCGALLKQALATVRDEPTADEESLLAGMERRQGGWAEALAPRLNTLRVRIGSPRARG